MLNWKKMFSKRENPKDIPVLNDIIVEGEDEHSEDDYSKEYPHLFQCNASEDIASENIEAQTKSVQLDAIVDDIVKQLMPELEQQLQILVQQALVEKLPEEIINSLDNSLNPENNNNSADKS